MTMTLLLPSSAAVTALAASAINSIGATAGSVNAQEMDVKKGKQLLHHDGIQKDDQTAADLTNPAPFSIVKKQSTTIMKPDIGILSKDFLKNKGREQPVDKRFTIHRKKRASAADVDVGILSNGRQKHHTPDVLGRSLLPDMCPDKNGYTGTFHMFNTVDSGYFPKCSCPSPTTCGPELCECLELDADGDIFQCMDPLNQLCDGTMYIDGVPGPWSMEECVGSKYSAVLYCSMLPCFADGGSYWPCLCKWHDSYCTESRDPRYCAMSKCCQAQTDDEGREACILGDLSQNYDEVISFSVSYEETISGFNECSLNSHSDKSIVECYCESFSYRLCVNDGRTFPVLCEAMNCCWEQTEDDARLDCFTTRFRDWRTGSGFHIARDTIQESCVASGKSSDQCKCDIHGLSNCVFGMGFIGGVSPGQEPSCDLFKCCQVETDDEGRKDCLVQDEAEQRYGRCLNDGNTTEYCYCDKSKTLCFSGHSNARHCELSSCCQEQADDAGRKECIGNFTTSQPSSAPSETTPAEDSSPKVDASPTATSTMPGASSAAIPTPFGVKSLSKARVLTVVSITVWLLLT